MKIEITGHPIRHKKRLKELRLKLENDGAEVEVIYKITDHITIKREHTESKDKPGKDES
jgi:hypothetical protein